MNGLGLPGEVFEFFFGDGVDEAKYRTFSDKKKEEDTIHIISHLHLI